MNSSTPTENRINSTPQELREQAIGRLNSDLPENSHPEPAHQGSEEIGIRLQVGAWWMLGLLVLATGLLANQAWASSGWPLLQIALPGVFLLLSATCFSSLFLAPVEVVFCKSNQTVTVFYRFEWLTKKRKTLGFDEVESIHSEFNVVGDNDPEVSLVLVLKNQERFVLKRSAPDWSPSSPLLGYSGCLEPNQIESLRQRIASLTGIRNLGFLH